MKAGAIIAVKQGVIEVHVPITFRGQGRVKQIIAPNGAEMPSSRPQPNSSLVKALARAFRWRKLLENGTFATLRELAQAEKINSSYVSRVLRLTLLAPDIVEAVLSDRQPVSLTLDWVMQPFDVDWTAQRAAFK